MWKFAKCARLAELRFGESGEEGRLMGVHRRLFVGIGVPEETGRKALEAARRSVTIAQSSTLRWLAPENLHVTLSFLGSVEEGRMKGIVNALEAIGEARLKITLDGIDVFANAGAVI